MKLEDFDPLIQIQGIGRMKLSQAIKRAQEMLDDLAHRSHEPASFENWVRIKHLVDRNTLQAYIDSIVDAMRRIH